MGKIGRLGSRVVASMTRRGTLTGKMKGGGPILCLIHGKVKTACIRATKAKTRHVAPGRPQTHGHAIRPNRPQQTRHRATARPVHDPGKGAHSQKGGPSKNTRWGVPRKKGWSRKKYGGGPVAHSPIRGLLGWTLIFRPRTLFPISACHLTT